MQQLSPDQNSDAAMHGLITGPKTVRTIEMKLKPNSFKTVLFQFRFNCADSLSFSKLKLSPGLPSQTSLDHIATGVDGGKINC